MCGPPKAGRSRKRVSFVLPNDIPMETVASNDGSDTIEDTPTTGKLFPLRMPTAVGLLIILFSTIPSLFPLNRGFTVWFHWASFLYLLTQSRFLKKVLILTGTSICLGWYACLFYEYIEHGRFFDALYKNMPSILMKYMILEEQEDAPGSFAIESQGNQSEWRSANGTLDFESPHSLAAMVVCHVLDLLGHPLLTYYFWRRYHSTASQSTNSPSSASAQTEKIPTWSVLLVSYCYSRIWSFVHTYYNHGFLAWFYVGHHVYVIDDLGIWYPAYVMETLFYVSITIWKLTKTIRQSSVMKVKKS